MALDPIDELAGWATSVLRLLDESRKSSESWPDYWGPFDLVGVYHQRARIEALAGGPLGALLGAVDALLLTFTEDVGVAWVESIGLGEEAGDGWWWRLVPFDGPLRDELEDRIGRQAR